MTDATGPDAGDEVSAQQAWLALLKGDSRPAEGLTDRQWARLADEATRHHLRGVTYRRLADSTTSERVPAAVRERLRSFYLETAGRNAVFYRQTSQLAKELAARGIPVMLLKGMQLSRFVYAESGLRSMADVDLMVRREQLEEAEQVFVERGFGPLPRANVGQWCVSNYHLEKLAMEGAPVVELHWSIERPDAPFTIDLEGLWRRSRTVELDGVPVQVLSSEDLLLHLALHLAYHHRFKRSALKGLVDIATLVAAPEGVDWEVVAKRGTSWGASGYLYTSLRLAADLLAAPIPPAVFGSLPHRPVDEEVVAVAGRYIVMLRADVPRAYRELAHASSLGERIRITLAGVFLPRARMEGMYQLRAGSPLVYPAYLRRLASLARQRGALLFRSFFGTRALETTLAREHDQALLERWHPAPPE